MSFVITKTNAELFGYKQHAWHVYKPKIGKLQRKSLISMFELFETMLHRYSRVLVIRVDLHPGAFNPTNSLINKFMAEQKAKLKTRYGCECAYMCAREQASADKEHYHLAIMLSAHKIDYPHSLLEALEQDWRRVSDGHAYRTQKCYSIIHRGNRASIIPAVYRLSYLTKTHTKKLNPKRIAGVIFNTPKCSQSLQASAGDSLLVDPKLSTPLKVLRRQIQASHQAGKSNNKEAREAHGATTSKCPNVQSVTARFPNGVQTLNHSVMRQQDTDAASQHWRGNHHITVIQHATGRAVCLNPNYKYREDTLMERWIQQLDPGNHKTKPMNRTGSALFHSGSTSLDPTEDTMHDKVSTGIAATLWRQDS